MPDVVPFGEASDRIGILRTACLSPMPCRSGKLPVKLNPSEGSPVPDVVRLEKKTSYELSFSEMSSDIIRLGKKCAENKKKQRGEASRRFFPWLYKI